MSEQAQRVQRSTWRRVAWVAAVIMAAVVASSCGGGGDADENADEAGPTIPAFTAAQLSNPPGRNWVTNGGTLANDRYSPLDEINAGNVERLGAVWHVDLDSAKDAKYSAETQILTYNDVMYLATGENDVLAIDAETGDTIWRVEGELDQEISTVCCGWLSRGVAIGEGMIFSARLDGDLVALDQEDGSEVWRTKVVDWEQDNSGLTAAPLYYDGLVYIGNTGGDYGARGRMTAFDAQTGEEVWRFWTAAGPDDPIGGPTWEGDSYKTGGAPVWQTPSIDPELGNIYFTTGNANPDVDGSGRGGDNLYTVSMVALDAKSGEYRWHFQFVHHDIWDYDAPSPTVQYTAEIDGEQVPAIAEPAKTGWLYVLNRETGEPIFDIVETPVPQDRYQKTSPTQPIPTNPPFASHEVTDAAVRQIAQQVRANTPEGQTPPPVRKGTGAFDPPPRDAYTVVAPGPTGGTNWPPSSYNHKTRMIYVCSLNGQAGLNASGVEEVEPGQLRLGSIFAPLPFGPTPGNLTAINGDTGEIEWQLQWEDSCYSGSVTTAGNLVFVGRNNGELQAYSADEGEHLWSFQTGAGANNTVTVFELGGKQHVAFYAGGNSLAATPHGDELWLFALDGELEEAPEPGPGSGTDHYDTSGDQGDEDPNIEDSPEGDKDLEGDAEAGSSVFANNCAGCHGSQGTGGNGGPTLANATNVQDVIAQVTNGGASMPAFRGQLSQQEIKDVSAYVTEQLAAGEDSQ